MIYENNVPELSRSNHIDNQDQTGTILVHCYHEPSSKANNSKIQTCEKGKTYSLLEMYAVSINNRSLSH